MNGLRETCHCGHDKASHYVDRAERPRVAAACLCTGCSCRRYADSFEPKPAVPDRGQRPDHAHWCRCAKCRQFVEPAAETFTDEAKTDPNLP